MEGYGRRKIIDYSRGRIAVFSQNVLRDERIVIVAEQKGGVTEEESFEVPVTLRFHCAPDGLRNHKINFMTEF